jgi:hypothetical protein
MIPANKVTAWLNPNSFITDQNRSATEIKNEFLSRLAALETVVQQQEIQNGTEINSVRVSNYVDSVVQQTQLRGVFRDSLLSLPKRARTIVLSMPEQVEGPRIANIELEADDEDKDTVMPQDDEESRVYIDHNDGSGEAPMYSFSLRRQSDILATKIVARGRLSIEEFIDLQKHDRFCKEKIQLLDKGCTDTKKKYRIAAGILMKYKLKEEIDRTGDGKKTKVVDCDMRLVLPENLIYPLVDTMHNNNGAHMSKDRVLSTIKQMFCAPKLDATVKDIIKRCRACQLARLHSQPPPPLGEPAMALYPRAGVSLDLAISLPQSKEGYIHLLVICCQASKFVALAPLKSKSGDEILQAFITYWCSWASTPLFIRSDNELGIVSGPFREWADKHDITIRTSPSFSPWANGQAEAFVRVSKASIRAFTLASGKPNEWPRILWLVSSQLNAMTSRRLGMSPEFCMFRHGQLALKTHPIVLFQQHDDIKMLYQDEICQDAIIAVKEEVSKIPELIEDLDHVVPEMPEDSLEVINHIIRLRQKNRQEAKGYKDNHKMPTDFFPGQLVWKREMQKNKAPGAPAALNPKYTGPWLILRTSGAAATLVCARFGGDPITAHKFYLKSYFHNPYSFVMPATWSDDIIRVAQQTKAEITGKAAPSDRELRDRRELKRPKRLEDCVT